MLVAIIFRLFLWCLGWQLIPQETFDYLNKHDRLVIAFSHTSYVDFYIMTMYMLAYPHELRFIRILVKPQPFAYIGWLLRRFGAIPATRVDDHHGGAVTRIARELQEEDKTLFLISPKGTIVKREWRSGYYHIARMLNAPLLASGLDYERRAIVVSKAIPHEEGESVVKHFLYDQLSKIVPLFPEEEVMTIREHNGRSVVDYRRLSVVILVVGLLTCMLW